ncbi:Nonribosomal Peptide Synthase (NRPS) [Pseudogymnoascus verrucosus]|uniref:Nonribosomal Peptide Synthase (NRPS) n=1 Tax=Pseudogymnoascus verrucosus TaxID=342668 RepID=A0A1B8G717_9PEZI|nr:Nonribosomal Peptide Synthase (NRPS) [Pseudogymnoascus verrucosus]OBT91629.1 Nonribosomal Peptide Synthase (NRPS) [Pseudogymnoascus verrucosus]
MALWVVLNDQERSNMTDAQERLWGYSKKAGMLTGYSMGYYLWDLITMMKNTRSFGTGMLLHSQSFLQFYAPWGILYQLSNPFLQVHWFCDMLDMTGCNVQLCNGLALLFVFFWSRIICGNYQSLGLYHDIWTSYCKNHSPISFDSGVMGLANRNPSDTCQATQEGCVPLWLAFTTSLAVAALSVMNCFWFYKLIRSMNRRFILAKQQPKRCASGILKVNSANVAGTSIFGWPWRMFVKLLPWLAGFLYLGDRIALREKIVKTLQLFRHTAARIISRKLVLDMRDTSTEKLAPLTEMEVKVQRLWAEILELDVDTIGLKDNFFRLGGNSVQAVSLVAASRAHGVQFTVADLFANSTISELSLVATGIEKSTHVDLMPFEISSGHEATDTIVDEAAAMCTVHRDNIADLYPCTPLQESLMALSIRTTGAYVAQHLISLKSTLDVDRFRACWETAVKSSPILRTRIVQSNSSRKMLQVVIQEHPSWAVSSDLQTYLENDKRLTMSFGEPLNRCAIVNDITSAQSYLVWTMHHCIYDGWSLSLIIKTLLQLYEGATVPNPTNFNSFVKHVEGANGDAARAFWQSQLSSSQPSTFPIVTGAMCTTTVESSYKHQICISRTTNTDITTPTIIRAAWALLMSMYENSNTVVFGVTIAGRNAPVSGIENIVGPTIATVPFRVNIHPNQTISEYLEVLQKQATTMIPFEQYGLLNIKAINSETQSACEFQNLLVIHPTTWSKEIGRIGSVETYLSELENDKTYPLVMECTLTTDGIQIKVSFDSKIVDKPQIVRLTGQFEHLINQICWKHEVALVGEIKMINRKDQTDICAWNSNCPEAVEACVHETVAQQVVARPDAPAVYGWDASFSYRKLDELSTQLARHLVGLGVGPEKFVPLCFEKSAWTIVAMLAVLKAGGACVSLDPKHPIDRLQAIIADLNADLIISSTANAALFKGVVDKIVSVGPTALFRKIPLVPHLGVQKARPYDPAFVIFTSGSTGKPKGVVLTHASFCTTARQHGAAMFLGFDSRVLQFAAYTFDLSLAEIFSTLVHGGCVCVPSEKDKMDNLGKVIRTMKINVAHLTSSVANLVRPKDVPGLKFLAVGGEATTQGVVKRWADSVYLVSVYGPSECTVFSSCLGGLQPDTSGANIGRGIGSVLWVVDPGNHERLMPIGCVGELLIEGPILAHGYLNDQEKTTAVFIENPEWAEHFGLGRRRRFYKTGDLVRYNPDGTLNFMGRKDTQVKLRGQRLELGEIEHHLELLVPSNWKLIVEMIRPTCRDGDPMLAAFICTEVRQYDTADADLALSALAAIHDKMLELENGLAAQLPGYMMPAVYIPLQHLPLTSSGKTDRLRLRQLGARLTVLQLTACSVGERTKRPPSTVMELKLQQLWAEVLHLELSSIGADDSFFRLGGDSIRAMRLVAASREKGIVLTVAGIFQTPTLSDMSQKSNMADDDSLREIAPFGLWEETDSADFNRLEEIGAICNVAKDQIEDVYPCTPQQEGMMAISARQHKAYMARRVFKLPQSLDLGRFQMAWDRLAEVHAILRTRIVPAARSRPLQVVVREKISWHRSGSLDEYLKQDEHAPMSYGQSLTRYAILGQADARVFVLTVHHALYDGWSSASLFEQVSRIYREGSVPQPVPYNRFIHYLAGLDHERAAMYWQSQLSGKLPTSFPPLPSATYQPRPNDSIRQFVPMMRGSNSSVLTSTIVRAAWAVVVAQLSDSDDVLFVVTLTGRNAPVPGIMEIIAPTFTTVPMRMRLDRGQPVPDYLNGAQSQAAEMIPFEHTGPQNIRRLALDFKHLLLIQPYIDQGEQSSILGLEVGPTHLKDFDSYALVMECNLAKDGVFFEARFDATVVPTAQMQKILNLFHKMISLLNEEKGDMKLGDVLTS